MNYIYELKSIFSQPDVRISERVKCVDISFVIADIPDFCNLVEFIESFPARDKVRIILTDDSEDRLIFDNAQSVKKSQYDSFCENAELSESINVTVTIEKGISNGCISIYCYNEFVKDICSLDLFDILCVFSELLEQQEFLNFIVYDNSCSFMTKTMCFSPDENKMITDGFCRLDRLQESRDMSRISCSKKIDLIPDDFRITVDTQDNPITDIFKKLTTLLSVAFTATSFGIDKQKFSAQVTGQRCMTYEANFSDLKNNDEIYKIYNWIYTDGNAIDKAIIARNVLSLHCKYTNLLEIDALVFASIQSNYTLYLRDNVSQYLDLKNKVAEYICDVITRTGEYSMSILEKFKHNLIAVFGFLFTVILANIVSDAPLDNIFTYDITLIIEIILGGSVIFWGISLYELKYNINKVETGYEALKENYLSVLSQDDIKEVFNNDSLIINTKKEINKKVVIISIIWLLLIAVGLIVVENVSDYTPIATFFSEAIKLFKKIINSFGT